MSTKFKITLFLIAISLFLIGIIALIKNEKITIESYLNRPEVGDLYLIEKSYLEDTSYYFMRLGAINSTKDSFSFNLNQKFYPQRPLELSEDDYFVEEERQISSQYLDTLFKKDKILSIQRSSGILASHNKKKPKLSIDAKYSFITADTIPKIWQTLLSLKFEISFDEKSDDVLFKPMYTEDIKKLDGRMITLKAFMYAKSVSDATILLSAYCEDFRNSCMSSNSAESVIEISNTPALVFKACKSCIVRGELSLNRDDYLEVPYSLKNIDFIRCEDLERDD